MYGLPNRRLRARSRLRRLFFEPLEDRSLLACSLDVTNTLDSGVGSLRDAITCANATANIDRTGDGIADPDVISFAIPGAGIHSIAPDSELPEITDSAIIDGYTQPGAKANTNGPNAGSNAVILIELNGANVASAVSGLRLSSDNSTVSGLAVNQFLNGIELLGGSGNVIAGNFIGTDPSGTVPAANSQHGVFVQDSANNTIGGTTPMARNVISNNLTGIGISSFSLGNIITGNLVGTDASGTLSLGNFVEGIAIYFDTSGALIGGTTPAARNIISGNNTGVDVFADSIDIQGNYIGTDVTGTQPLGNAVGIQFGQSNNGTVGGLTVGAGNVISGNSGSGIQFFASSNHTVQGNLIGLAANGTSQLGNGRYGILIEADASVPSSNNNRIEQNTIAFNGAGNPGAGIAIRDQPSHANTGNTIQQNSIFLNAPLGIDLNDDGATANDLQSPADADTGANKRQNYPGINSAAVSAADQTLSTQYSVPSSTANSSYPLTVEFFTDDGTGQGKTFLGSDSYTAADALKAKTVTFAPLAVVPRNARLIATATDASGNTSEFSIPFPIDVPLPNCSTVVTTTNDSGPGSLRAVLTCANARAVDDTISFNIPGTGVHTIAPLSALPVITSPVIIDGYTQPEASPNTNAPEQGDNAVLRIELTGNSLSGTDPVSGLTLNSDNCTIQGLAIHDFDTAIAIADGFNNAIQGNFLGTDVSGAASSANSHIGVSISAQSGINQIGGFSPAARNLISGNQDSGLQIAGNGNQVLGNLIGLDASGAKSFNTKPASGILIVGGANNFVGGASELERNIISGNTTGVSITGSLAGNYAFNNLIEGNFIGTDVTGKLAVGNSLGGVKINGNSVGNFVGGTSPAAGNLISGNGGFGVSIGSTAGECPNTSCVGSDTLIQGNYIGTDVTGTLGLGNSQGGVELANHSFHDTVGGGSAGVGVLGVDAFAGNLISGNQGNGITISADSNFIQGNVIGASRTGAPLGNTGHGIYAFGDYRNTIGEADNTWPLSAGGNGHTYVLTKFPGNAGSTFNEGNLLGGYLVSINSQAEQDFIASKLLSGANENQTYWIGAADFSGQGEFSWTTGEPFTYSNWNVGQPDDSSGDEFFVAMNWDHTHGGGPVGTWNDLPYEGRDNDGNPESYLGIVELPGPLGNTIAFNGQDGIAVVRQDFLPTVTILSNAIFSNGSLGIDLGGDGPTPNDASDSDLGANNLQNFPVISYATRDVDQLKVKYTVPSDPQNSTYPIRVEFFLADATGQGKTYLGFDTFTQDDFTAGGKTVTLSVNAPIKVSDKIVATATDSLTAGLDSVQGNTSEFSPTATIVSPWQNHNPGRLRWDVTDDTHVVADDVLTIINYINAKGSGKVPDNAANAKPFLDVDGDDSVVAADVIDVINYINAGKKLGGEAEAAWEGEAPAEPVPVSSQPPLASGQSPTAGEQSAASNDVMALLAADVAAQAVRKRRI